MAILGSVTSVYSADVSSRLSGVPAFPQDLQDGKLHVRDLVKLHQSQCPLYDRQTDCLSKNVVCARQRGQGLFLCFRSSTTKELRGTPGDDAADQEFEDHRGTDLSGTALNLTRDPVESTLRRPSVGLSVPVLMPARRNETDTDPSVP